MYSFLWETYHRAMEQHLLYHTPLDTGECSQS